MLKKIILVFTALLIVLNLTSCSEDGLFHRKKKKEVVVTIYRQWLIKNDTGTEFLWDLSKKSKYKAAMKYSADYCKENNLNPNAFYVYEEGQLKVEKKIDTSGTIFTINDEISKERFKYVDLTENTASFLFNEFDKWQATAVENISILPDPKKDK
ncbi:MAG: hypothetical protein IK065_07530 [Neisseriaceae bacterium]|nr:hypothetical protein [Neisseriaceae bacterium]